MQILILTSEGVLAVGPFLPASLVATEQECEEISNEMSEILSCSEARLLLELKDVIANKISRLPKLENLP